MNTSETIGLRTCKSCGIEYRGGSQSQYCPECRRIKITREDTRPAETVKGSGWRHMFRDKSGGSVIRAGGNVIRALDDLCKYEEILEAAGVRGPEELRDLLAYLTPEGESLRKMIDCATRYERREREKAAGLPLDTKPEIRRKQPDDVKRKTRKRPGTAFCENCASFRRIKGTGRGICGQHPMMVRPEGRGGKMQEVPGKHREVAARRKACGTFVPKEETDKQSGQPDDLPQWVGPSAELMPQEG